MRKSIFVGTVFLFMFFVLPVFAAKPDVQKMAQDEYARAVKAANVTLKAAERAANDVFTASVKKANKLKNKKVKNDALKAAQKRKNDALKAARAAEKSTKKDAQDKLIAVNVLKASDTKMVEWVEVGTMNVQPVLVYKGELYGRGMKELGTFRLVDNDWVKVGKSVFGVSTHEVEPEIVFNDELFGTAGVQLYKLSGEDWVNVGSEGNLVSEFAVHRGELYAYSLGYFNPVKLVRNKWERVGTRKIHNFVEFNNELYGSHIDTGIAARLVGTDWVPVGADDFDIKSLAAGAIPVTPKRVFKGELYGIAGSTYKLSGNAWVKAASNPVRPTVEYNEDLYGAKSGVTYKFVAGNWIKFGTAAIEPIVVHNGDLYGYDTYNVEGKARKLKR